MQPRTEELFSEQLNNIEDLVVFPNTMLLQFVRTQNQCTGVWQAVVCDRSPYV